MSVLIKGMEMPKCCADCCFNYDMFKCLMTGKSTLTLVGDIRLENCPLIELPPHGRLVDIESVRAKARDVMLSNGAKHRCVDATALYEIPIIIEAEVKE